MMHSQPSKQAQKSYGRSGFTLVEIMLGAGILSIFLIFVGQFYLRGNQAAAKSTWRTHTAAQLRMALKVMQQGLERTAYPTFTSATNFDELDDSEADATAYKVTFGDGSQTLEPSAPITLMASSTSGVVLEFATAIPYSVGQDGSTASGGITTKFTFRFPDESKTVPNTDIQLKPLLYKIEGGSYTYSSGTFSGAATFDNELLSERSLLNDVHKVTFSMLPRPTNTNIHKATIQIDIECRDPFDGRHVVSQTMLHMIHTDTNPSP